MTVMHETRPKFPKIEEGSELDHFYCCDEDISMCGFDISDLPVVDFGLDNICVVCAEINICPICGTDWTPNEPN